MSDRIRGQEATIQVIEDGAVQTGSFFKILNWELTPRADLVETPFCGEAEDEIDEQHHGWDFSWEQQEEEDKAMQLYLRRVTAQRDGLPTPKINIVLTKKYRSASIASAVYVLQNVKVKLERQGAGGRKEYVSVRWTGKCKRILGV